MQSSGFSLGLKPIISGLFPPERCFAIIISFNNSTILTSNCLAPVLPAMLKSRISKY